MKIPSREITTGKHDSEPGRGWVIYRLPGQQEITFLQGKIQTIPFDECLPEGFIVAPFHVSADNLFHLQADQKEQFLNADHLEEAPVLKYFFRNETGEDISEDNYEDLVRTVLVEIERNTLQKAVPARTKHIALPRVFSMIQFYKSLLLNYPDAFVYLLSSPLTGTWAGCSPELLFHAERDAISTLSLAGTRKAAVIDSKGLDEPFTGKEFEEQDIVTRYISGILNQYCEDIATTGPTLRKAGNVSHLATIFNAKLKLGFSGKYGAVVKNLHPTPAVCGLPANHAMEFLLREEKFNRELYSGFMGPVSEGHADLYVNLRCMQLFQNSACLYAGAGIVRGSDPEKEWKETEEKMNTLLRFMR
jgi:isochorismate synthase